METSDHLERGRDSYRMRAWADAYEHLSAIANELGPDDLERLADTAYLIGREEKSAEVMERAHMEALSADDVERAVKCAFWLGFRYVNAGDEAQAGGWFARARRLLDEHDLDCAGQGYMLIPVALQSLFGGEAESALELFGQIDVVAERFEDSELRVLAWFGRGQSLMMLGRIDEATELLDEVMVEVTTAEASPIITGLVYCGVIQAYQEAFDLMRAQQWTDALSRWCSSQPDLVPYRGQCLIHRAELMLLHGSWEEALEEARRARDALLGAPDRVAAGGAFYQLAELHRAQGDFDEAEDAYREASRWGRSPQPGLALLRLAQGRLEDAEGAVQRLEKELRKPVERVKMLPAFVEITLAAGAQTSAKEAADELSTIAGNLEAPLLNAYSGYCDGAVLLAQGQPREALDGLRRACTLWQQLEVPYETARTRVLIAEAYEALGDHDTALIEMEGARHLFEELGAEPDVERLEKLLPSSGAGRRPSGLTGREIEVLALVATGKTNREIAGDLVISEKTVARHLSNIFTKLGVSSRSAATAYAYQHDLA